MCRLAGPWDLSHEGFRSTMGASNYCNIHISRTLSSPWPTTALERLSTKALVLFLLLPLRKKIHSYNISSFPLTLVRIHAHLLPLHVAQPYTMSKIMATPASTQRDPGLFDFSCASNTYVGPRISVLYTGQYHTPFVSTLSVNTDLHRTTGMTTNISFGFDRSRHTPCRSQLAPCRNMPWHKAPSWRKREVVGNR
jgi:hypothetical protein